MIIGIIIGLILGVVSAWVICSFLLAEANIKLEEAREFHRMAEKILEETRAHHHRGHPCCHDDDDSGYC